MPKLSGLYQGITFYAIAGNTASSSAVVDALITSIATIGFRDRIITLFYFPTSMVSVLGSGDGFEQFRVVNENPQGGSSQPVIHNVTRNITFDDYTPVNRKLYTYPYMFLNVDSLSENKTFKWENFRTSPLDDNNFVASFRLYGILSTDPAVICVPQLHNGFGQDVGEEIIIKGFEQLTSNSDTVIELLGNNGVVTKLGGLAASAALSFGNPNLGFAGYNVRKSLSYSHGATRIDREVINKEGELVEGKPSRLLTDHGIRSGTRSMDLLAKKRAINDIAISIGQETIGYAQNLMASMRERNGSGNYDIATGLRDIYYKKMTIRKEFAEKIDKFFTAYGYAVNTIKVPQRMNRAKWSYVRTKDCIIEGELPSVDKEKIEDIFDSGIRFWNVVNGAVVGDYSNPTSNTPLGQNT